jgi:hypothetical protein
VYYLADEPGVHFVWQPNQESSVLAMSHAFDVYYIEDCGVIGAEGDAEEDRQQCPLAIVGVAFVSAVFNSLRKHTHLPFCLSKRVWWCVPDD